MLGSITAASGGAVLFAPHTPKSWPTRLDGIIALVTGSLAVTAGIWLCRRPAYRPDVADIHPMLGKAEGYNAEYAAEQKRARRTWWTGDPSSDRHRDHDA
jgi:hypothetical protein